MTYWQSDILMIDIKKEVNLIVGVLFEFFWVEPFPYPLERPLSSPTSRMNIYKYELPLFLLLRYICRKKIQSQDTIYNSIYLEGWIKEFVKLLRPLWESEENSVYSAPRISETRMAQRDCVRGVYVTFFCSSTMNLR